MRVLIIGAAGMIGRKLTAKLGNDRPLGQPVARRALDQPLEHLTLADVVAPAVPADFPNADIRTADISQPGVAAALLDGRPDLIFHLAAIVSGEAEADVEKGYRINLDGTRDLFDAIRLIPGYTPRVVFTSSLAVFGAPFPDSIGDDFHLTPLTSYGTQKAIGELLLADYSRRGFLDGIGIRLPTICIRPGLPNKAASSFFSGILREPLSGHEAILPVAHTLRHWFASPRAAIGMLLHAATLDTALLGARRTLSMPGLSATVADQIEALRRVAGDKAVRLIRRQPDPAVQAIVGGWAQRFDATRATSLGFTAETSFDDIIRAHIDDELGGTIGAAA